MNAANSGRTFVGFGFGPIQAGLFLYEAQQSGNFDRYVVAEIDEALVDGINHNGGRCVVNIARPDRIDSCELAGLELLNPRNAEDREALVSAVAEAGELATAVPSVAIYSAGGAASVVGILSEGLSARPPRKQAILYAAENSNDAAETLTGELEAAGAAMGNFQIVNTVIGKMSGVIRDEAALQRCNLTPVAPGMSWAILVEQFNRIQISRVTLNGFRRGIDVFQEKDDLLPFEEAKLYGHNAIHALMGYLAEHRGHTTMAEVKDDPWIMSIAREAFGGESALGVIGHNAGADDPLFTAAGYQRYADDLLERMTCPYLNDLIQRVTRDHARKLGYDDRLFGAMRLALRAGVRPVRCGLGAAAAVLSMIRRRDELTVPLESLPADASELTAARLTALLHELWQREPDATSSQLCEITWDSITQLLHGEQP